MNRRRVMLVVIVSLIAFATSASAECAWVLWKFYPSDSRSADAWATPEAFMSAQECAKALRKSLAVHKRDDKDAPRVVEMMDGPYKGAITFIYQGGNRLLRMESSCLPDTVDPRGPKSK